MTQRMQGRGQAVGLLVAGIIAGMPSGVFAEPDEVPQGIMADPAADSAQPASEASPATESREAGRGSPEGEARGKSDAQEAESDEESARSQPERLRTVVDLSFTNANLRNVLNSLAKTYGLNIVASEDVAGTVTLTLRGVTVEEGLRQMLKLNGFGFTVSEGIIEVEKLEEKRVADLLYLKYLTPDTALEFIQPMASEGATLKIDEPTNAILIHDYLAKIDTMREVLKIVDQPPQQVLIDSRLIDITHTDLDNLGLKFESLGATVPLHPGGLSTAEPRFPLVISSGSGSLGGVSSSGTVGTAGPSSSLTGGQLVATLAQGNDTLKMTLDALIRNQQVKVLANPSVLTLNNVEAKITIGEKFPIREQTQTSTGTLETTRFVDVGTALRVTPRINRDGVIHMHIHPEVSSVSDSTLSAGPRITTREADATVLVRDGQPIVIAGLLSEDRTIITGKVPVLGHLPIVGLVFQNRSKDHAQKELVVIITPHLVNVFPNTTQPQTPVQEVADRLDVLELFAEALAMEENRTLKARRLPELVRAHEAVQLYQRLADRFPLHPYAMEALWRISRLGKDPLQDPAVAERALERLTTRFPAGPYRERAQRQLQVLRRAKQARRPTITTRTMTARSIDVELP